MIRALVGNRTLVGVAGALAAIIVGAHFGSPALINHVTFIDSENLAIEWLKGMEEQFDLPGTLPASQDRYNDPVSQLLLPNLHAAESKRDFDLFHPRNFEAGNHLSRIRGYTVFTPFGDRFVSGGRPVQRDVSHALIKSRFESILKNGGIQSFINPIAAAAKQRVVSVFVPLMRGQKPAAVAVVDVERSAFEITIFGGIERVATFTALFVSVIALAILTMMKIWDGRRKSAETEVTRLAFYDPLTNLPNRRHFNAKFAHWLDAAKSGGSKLALLCIDVDGFKHVNDEHGHMIGDKLLIRIGAILQSAVGDRGFVSRLSGDEFTVVLNRISGADDATGVADDILNAQKDAETIDGCRVGATLSIGIGIFPDDGKDGEDLLRNADLALYQAKARGRSQYCVFTEDIEKDLRRRRRLQHDLRRDLTAGGLEMHYQPQVDTVTGTLTGFEALARWTHEEDGPIPPSDFIPIAEQSGLIKMLGAWTLHASCEEAATWPENLTVAVNLSAAMFDDGEIVDTVRKALGRSGLEPSRLELEITESLLMDETEAVSTALRELRELGVGIAMDDFGTGYSSLSYLSRIPVTKIKIDRSFVNQLGGENNIESIIHSIVGLGDSLGVEVLAEGVETVAQLRRLQMMGCKHVQGFLYGRPRHDPFADGHPLSAMLTEIEQRLAG